MYHILANKEKNNAVELSQLSANSAIPECIMETSKAVDRTFLIIEAEIKSSNSATTSTEEKKRDGLHSNELPIVEGTELISN